MNDISLIPVFYNLLEDSFFKLSESSYKPFYTICDTPQPLPDISSGVSPSIPKSFLQSPKDAHDRHFKSEFLDRTMTIVQDFGSYEPQRSRNCSIAMRWQRQRSHRLEGVRSCRSASQEKQKYAAKTEKVRTLQNYTTLAGKDLRAFLLVRTVISWRVLAYRFSLKKSAQIEREAWRSTGDQERSFWRWIDPHPDSAIVLLEDAAFLQEGGAS